MIRTKRDSVCVYVCVVGLVVVVEQMGYQQLTDTQRERESERRMKAGNQKRQGTVVGTEQCGDAR